jgi:hypothetical protein
MLARTELIARQCPDIRLLRHLHHGDWDLRLIVLTLLLPIIHYFPEELRHQFLYWYIEIEP